MIAVHDFLCLDDVVGGEFLVSVEFVVVGFDLSSQHEFEEIGEEILLSVLGSHGIVEDGVSVFGEVKFSIEVSSPGGVFRHRLCGGELSVGGSLWRVGLCLLFLLFGTSFGRLCHCCGGAGKAQGEQSKADYVHCGSVYDDFKRTVERSCDAVRSDGFDA